MEKNREKSKTPYWLIGISVTIAFLFILVPPLFSLINRVEPFILGLPFSIFMILVFGLFIAGMLVLLYHIQNIREEL